ncbi:MAG: hypothetical protein ACYSWO_09525 [Planctomycetota bacterium]|jgi:hypothetical protein
MMKNDKLYYIELKSDHGDSGPAWISRVKWSKSGRTLYFNGRALKRGNGVSGNFFCLETGAEFWVSGVRKNGQDRHWAGGGPVMVDSRVVEEYLAFRGVKELNPALHPVVSDIQETDISKFNRMENEAR